jgi:hypothetical protein
MATLITPVDGVATLDLKVALRSGVISVEWIEDGALRSAAIRIDGAAAVIRT